MANCPRCGRSISSQIYVPINEGRTKSVKCECGYTITYQVPKPRPLGRMLDTRELIVKIGKIIIGILSVAEFLAGLFSSIWVGILVNRGSHIIIAVLSGIGVFILTVLLLIPSIIILFPSESVILPKASYNPVYANEKRLAEAQGTIGLIVLSGIINIGVIIASIFIGLKTF
ncbi:MAG: hypothetical protein FWD66_11005 [Paludibacter sp.]|nr:hypothetical protein [Paludibacter sp.]